MEEPYQNVTRDYSSTPFRLIIFILVANIIGTNIFIPHYFTLEFALEIWTSIQKGRRCFYIAVSNGWHGCRQLLCC